MVLWDTGLNSLRALIHLILYRKETLYEVAGVWSLRSALQQATILKCKINLTLIWQLWELPQQLTPEESYSRRIFGPPSNIPCCHQTPQLMLLKVAGCAWTSRGKKKGCENPFPHLPDAQLSGREQHDEYHRKYS